MRAPIGISVLTLLAATTAGLQPTAAYARLEREPFSPRSAPSAHGAPASDGIEEIELTAHDAVGDRASLAETRIRVLHLARERGIGSRLLLTLETQKGFGSFSRRSAAVNRYAMGNPINNTDPDGHDAIPVTFVDYQIQTPAGKLPYLGHAGIILINNETGVTRYYEYGRYDEAGLGRTQNVAVPNVKIDSKTGKPTEASLKGLLDAVSIHAGKGSRVEGTYVEADFRKMETYAQSRIQQNNDPAREPYSILGNNCGTFAKDTLEAAGKGTPLMIDPRPNSYIEELQAEFGNRVSYNPSTNQVTK